jgi:hypothetical protein
MWKKIKVKGLVPTPRNCVSGSANDNLFIVFGGYGRSEKERFSDVFAYNPAGSFRLSLSSLVLASSHVLIENIFWNALLFFISYAFLSANDCINAVVCICIPY